LRIKRYKRALSNSFIPYSSDR